MQDEAVNGGDGAFIFLPLTQIPPPSPPNPSSPTAHPFCNIPLLLPYLPFLLTLTSMLQWNFPFCFFFYLFPSSKLLPQGTLVNVSAILRSLCPPAGAQRAVQMQRITLTKLQVLNNVLKNK